MIIHGIILCRAWYLDIRTCQLAFQEFIFWASSDRGETAWVWGGRWQQLEQKTGVWSGYDRGNKINFSLLANYL